MPTLDRNTVRYDDKDPADFAYLVDTGLVWQGPTEEQQRAIDMLTAGELPLNRKTVSPALLPYIESQMFK